MRFLAVIALAFVLTTVHAGAQDVVPAGALCGTRGIHALLRSTDETGGRHITASGTLRILLVFASFSDDDAPNPYWPPHQPPVAMSLFLDPDTATHSTASFNLTNYFNQMSLGQFHFVGDVVWVESTHGTSEFSNGSYGRANTTLLTEQLDTQVDFSRYDHWTNAADYVNIPEPDSVVDMIVMVWRTNTFPYVGEASLGRKPTLVLDGVKIGMGYPEDYAHPLGSGVTCEYLYTDTPDKVMRTIAHEVGHWLLGGAHPYNGDVLGGKHSYWGILCDGHRISSCVNSYERELLGWVSVPELVPDSSYALPDYLTSGKSLKYHPENGSPLEYFYIENHQRRSVFDDVTVNPDDRGVWVLHQQGPYQELDNIRIEPSDGRWQWDDGGLRNSCFGQDLTLFRKREPGVVTGPSHRDMIASKATDVNWLMMVEGAGDTVHCGQFYAGEQYAGSFDTCRASVFSRFSNPSSNTWDGQATGLTLELTGNSDGTLLIAASSNPLSPAPSRRYLGVDPSVASVQGGAVSLAWGAMWQDGQPIEATVNSSELQRLSTDGHTWVTVYVGPSLRWKDQGVTYDSMGAALATYRVRVGETSGRQSNWSMPCVVRVSSLPSGVSPNRRSPPESFELFQNFPNPFNPKTVVRGQWSVTSVVRLAVYDVLGREVAVLASGLYPAGKYQFSFDGTNLSSGEYFYRLTAGNYTAVRKMTLVR